MDERDGRIRAAYRSLTEPTDLERSSRAIGIAIRAAGRPRRRGVPARFAAAVAASLLVVVSVVGAAIVFSRPGPTTGPSDGPAVSSVETTAPGTDALPPATEVTVPTTPPVLDWQRQSLDAPASGPGTMGAITGGGSGVVAVGWTTDLSHHHNTPTSERHHTEALAWRSFDGGPWWRVAAEPGFEHAAMQDVAWSRGVLVAVGYDDSAPDGARTTRIWSSPDGASWTVLPDSTLPANSHLTRVLGTADGFLASGVEVASDGSQRSVVWRSADGASWVRATDRAAFEDGIVLAIFETADGLVAIGDAREDLYAAQPVLWRSSDGSQWAQVPLPDDPFGSGAAGIAGIVSGGPGYIAVGTVIDTVSPQDPAASLIWPPTDGAIWTSPDLRSWTRAEPARQLFGGEDDEAISSVVAVRGGYIAFGSAAGAAAAWSSGDAERWERAELPEAANAAIDDATVMNGTVVAVGGVGDAPAVWLGRAQDAANSPAAIEGIDYPITVYSHCGLDRSRFDFDGSLWKAVGRTSDGQGNPPPGYDNPFDSGTIRLLPDGAAEYTSSRGVRLSLERVDDPAPSGCY